MIIINFSHPLTHENRSEIEKLTGLKTEKVLDIPCQIDPQNPVAPQVEEILGSVPLTPQQWQTGLLLVNLPSLNYIAAVLLALVHGRTGHFPTILRLRPQAGSIAPRFEVAEIVNLQALRDGARCRRT